MASAGASTPGTSTPFTFHARCGDQAVVRPRPGPRGRLGQGSVLLRRSLDGRVPCGEASSTSHPLCRDEVHCHDEFERGIHRGVADLLVRRASAPPAHGGLPNALQRTRHARRTCWWRGEANILRCACRLAPREHQAADDGVAPGPTSRRSPRRRRMRRPRHRRPLVRFDRRPDVRSYGGEGCRRRRLPPGRPHALVTNLVDAGHVVEKTGRRTATGASITCRSVTGCRRSDRPCCARPSVRACSMGEGPGRATRSRSSTTTKRSRAAAGSARSRARRQISCALERSHRGSGDPRRKGFIPG